jgi:hypothetical protein
VQALIGGEGQAKAVIMSSIAAKTVITMGNLSLQEQFP